MKYKEKFVTISRANSYISSTLKKLFYNLNYTPEQEKEVKEYFDEMKQYCKEHSPTGNWRDSGIAFAFTQTKKSEKEIFLSLMAEKIYDDELHKRGAYGFPEVIGALEEGRIPTKAVEDVLVYHGRLGVGEIKAIKKGYGHKLRGKAKKILKKELEDVVEIELNLALIKYAAKLQEVLRHNGIDVDVRNMPLDEKIRKIFRKAYEFYIYKK